MAKVYDNHLNTGVVYYDDLDDANLLLTLEITATDIVAITGVEINVQTAFILGGDNSVYAAAAEEPVALIELVDSDVTAATAFELSFIGLTSSDISSNYSSAETATVFDGVVALAVSDSGIFVGLDTATLNIQGAVGKATSEINAFALVTESTTIDQFDPNFALASSDLVTINTTDTSGVLIYNDTISSSDLVILTAGESTSLIKAGSVSKTAIDSAIYTSLDIPNLKLQKQASDLLSILLAEAELAAISLFQYDPFWDEDDVAWGGVQLGALERAPIYVLGDQFFVLGRQNQNVSAYIERLSVVHSDHGFLLGLGLWPQIAAVEGTVVKVWMGGHNTLEGSVDWEGPYDFIVGQDNYLDFAVEGKYLAVRFESEAQPRWELQSYKVEFEPLGRN